MCMLCFGCHVGNGSWHCEPASFDNTNGISVVGVMHSKTYWLTLLRRSRMPRIWTSVTQPKNLWVLVWFLKKKNLLVPLWVLWFVFFSSFLLLTVMKYFTHHVTSLFADFIAFTVIDLYIFYWITGHQNRSRRYDYEKSIPFTSNDLFPLRQWKVFLLLRSAARPREKRREQRQGKMKDSIKGKGWLGNANQSHWISKSLRNASALSFLERFCKTDARKNPRGIRIRRPEREKNRIFIFTEENCYAIYGH